jgi:hypothetical protein
MFRARASGHDVLARDTDHQESTMSTTAEMRAATTEEAEGYLAGHLTIEGATETPEGLLVPVVTSTCLHCQRTIMQEAGRWIDPEAPATPEDGDDHMWRETCDSHDTFVAEHEPTPVVERSQRSYDPTLDLARVDEITVRRLVGIGTALSGCGTIVLQGRFTPGGRGCYGSVAVMVHRPNQHRPEECYSTHRAIVRAEDGSEPVVFAEAGHYDLTRAEAEDDLRTR